ncbi:MAG: CpsD/CapB family tyrosine-protein kinase [Clostridia bacterium]|nr:CpsD/CapB family tyrosine-protein kinase [Clostridia bacterium]
MDKSNIISYSEPKSIASEAYRALRTNLEFSLVNGEMKTVLITSSHVSEGKSSTASNLATVFAMQGKKTVLLDADMRRGTQHKKFDVQNTNGLSNYLAGKDIAENKFVKQTEIANLSLITCGPVPPNPAELISLDRMKQLIEDLKAKFDIVVIDGAPVLPVTDSVILSSIVDKVVVVASYGETLKDELKAVKATLDNAGASIAGVVFNKVTMPGKRYGRYNKYGRGYYSSYYYADDEAKTTTKKKTAKKK